MNTKVIVVKQIKY